MQDATNLFRVEEEEEEGPPSKWVWGASLSVAASALPAISEHSAVSTDANAATASTGELQLSSKAASYRDSGHEEGCPQNLGPHDSYWVDLLIRQRT